MKPIIQWMEIAAIKVQLPGPIQGGNTPFLCNVGCGRTVGKG